MELIKDNLKVKHLIDVKTDKIYLEDFIFYFIQVYMENNWDLEKDAKNIDELWQGGLKNSAITGKSLPESLDYAVEMGYLQVTEPESGRKKKKYRLNIDAINRTINILTS